MKFARHLLEGFHRAQQGAVMMLALAGIMIIFLTSLILVDGGFAIRHKFKAQISADAAAYSEAATKARAMNVVAYMNVAKRTYTGLWGMYVAMMYQFYREASGDVHCAFAKTWDPGFLGFFVHGDVYGSGQVRQKFLEYWTEINRQCDGGASQYNSYWHEARGDWLRFSGTAPRGKHSFADKYFGGPTHAEYDTNLAAIDFTQTQLVKMGPEWARTEGMARGRASGAEELNVDRTRMPTRRGAKMQICTRNYGHADSSIASGPELAAEIMANRNILARKSDRASKFKQDYEAANLAAGLQLMGSVGCSSLETNFDERIAPFIPTAETSQGFVNTGRSNDLAKAREDHFEFIDSGGSLGRPADAPTEGVSCGQIVDMAPEFRGFRASWAPRVAPVGQCRPSRSGWWK